MKATLSLSLRNKVKLLFSHKTFFPFDKLRASKLVLVFLFAVFLFLGGVGKVDAATTYTVCVSGCNATTIQAMFDNYDLGFGDIVEIQADTIGGSKTYADGKIRISSGDSGAINNPVIVRARSGDIITISGAGATFAIELYTVDYIRFQDLDFTAGSTATFYSWAGVDGIELLDSTFHNCAVGVMNSITTGSTFQNLTISTSTSIGFYLNGTGLWTGNTYDNITISNSGSNGMTISRGDFTGSTFNNITITSNGGNGIGIDNGATNLNISNSTATSNISNGFLVASASTANFLNSTADSNAVDGFSTGGSSSLTCARCISKNNGSAPASYGDGFTAHNGDTLILNNCLAYGNWTTGVGVIDASSGNIYNSTFYNNGNQKAERQTNIWIGGTGIWNVKNNITENAVYASILTATAITGNVVFDTNYNIYDEASFYYGSSFTVDFNQWKTQTKIDDSNSQNMNPLMTSPSTNNFTLQYLSPAIDAGTSVGLTTDFAGNPIYGLPDIGAYEYQPPHTMSTDEIDIAAGARVYGDGKFRDLSSTSSSTAELKVTPVSESFSTYTDNEVRPEWMDITNLTWSDTQKQWTENSDTLGDTTTAHTVGDLTPNIYYNISVTDTTADDLSGDACSIIGTDFVCQSNDQGQIVFNYSGGYSEHTFTVEEGDNVGPTTTASPNGGTYITNQTVTLTCDDADGVGCDKTYYTTDNTDPTTGSTQYTTPITISATTTLKFFSTDLSGIRGVGFRFVQ